MGNCQGSSTVIDKNIESEDSHSKEKTQKVQTFQALRDYNAEIDPIGFASSMVNKGSNILKASKNPRQIASNRNIKSLEEDYERNSQTVNKYFGQMNPQYKQEYQEYLELYNNCQGDWTDQSFPPAVQSLTEYPQSYQRCYEYSWKRVREIQGLGQQARVFQGGIVPQDILQGALGDCYLLSSLAALAENSEQHLISRLFETKRKNDKGVYGVWLCIFGEWQLVVVDDFFPCNKYGTPSYSKANGAELWVLLIEKAYAKVYGTYKKIEAGLTGNAIRDLTGAPYFYINNSDVEATWDLLEQHDDNFNIVTAGSQADTRGTEIKQHSGIVSGHAYSILDHKVVVSSRGQQCRIVQLRNPWGSHEWNGRFSDRSDEWTEESRRLCNVTDADDGIFWMPIEDYCQAYAETTINFLHRHYIYSSKKIQTNGNKQYLIDFTVDSANNNNSTGHISISQKPERYFEDATGCTDYSYSMVRLIIMRRTDSGYEYVQDLFKSDRDVDIHAKFPPGQYVALVEIDWCQNNYCTDFVISSYTESRTTFDQVTPLDNDEYLSYVDSAVRGLTNFGDKNVYNFSNNPNLKRIRGTMAGFIYFYYVNETPNYVVQEIANMTNILNLDICAPYDNSNQFEVDVKPAETVVVKYRIDESGWGAYSYGMKYRHGVGQAAGMGC